MRQTEPWKPPHAPGREMRCSPFILLEQRERLEGRRGELSVRKNCDITNTWSYTER